MKKIKIFFLASLVMLTLVLKAQVVHLPDGFGVQWVSTDWDQAVGMCFEANGRQYVWEKKGVVWIVDNGVKISPPLIDLQQEVGDYSDQGFLGFALDPDFRTNGYFYLYYCVDQNYLLNEGQVDFDPSIEIDHEATILRLTRFQADSTTDFQTTLPDSRQVLIGKTPSDGVPALHTSHTGGTILFGTDGTLLVTTGDGSTWKASYAGGGPPYFEEYVPEGLAYEIIRPAEDVGAFRSQLLNSHSGKILRINPSTGEGIPNNPFFDADNPQSAASRVWALGFRNPYRAILRPNTGTTNPEDGLPGSIYVADVGNKDWEEINVVTVAGRNYGWPMYEGMDTAYRYNDQTTFNLDIANPLSNGTCEPYFSFQSLVKQPSLTEAITFPNPCDATQEIDADYTFIHERPKLAFPHWEVSTQIHVPIFDENGAASEVLITDEASPIPEAPYHFRATAMSPIGFYEGNSFPDKYKGKFFMADYTQGWIKMLEMGLNDEVLAIEELFYDTINIVGGAFHPIDGSLHFLDYPRGIRKITYNENLPPIAVAAADSYYGTSPLTVQLYSYESIDPEAETISFLWDFGDGMTSTLPNPEHTFIANSDAPQTFDVQLTVTDEQGLSAVSNLKISLNNTPPQVYITSIVDGDIYAVAGYTELALEAVVIDTEHSENELSYAWQVFLHHNTHAHPEPLDTNAITQAFISPTPCDDEIYYYRIKLTVTDAHGLVGIDEVKIYPDCISKFVDLVNFKATKAATSVLCEWNTLQETSLATFEIERANSANIFEKIATIQPINTNNIATLYQYIDDHPNIGWNYYRLKMISNTGQENYSLIDSVFFVSPNEVTVSPNPSAGKFTFYFVQQSPMTTIRIFDANGRFVQLFRLENNGEDFKELDLKNYAKGSYFYQLEDGAQRKSGQLIIVE